MNKKSKKIKIIIAVLICVSFSAAGCAQQVPFLGSSETKYMTEKTVYLPMEKVKTLNPMISKDQDTYFISKLLYDGLFELDENLMPQKNLVDTYAYSDDKSSLNITVRRGIKWHDGKELTAEDVKFSIDMYVSLSYNNDTLYSGYVSSIKSVSTVKNDPYKCVITFRNKNNIGVENLIFPILPSYQFKKAEIKKNIDAFLPVGTGIYKVKSYNNLSQLVLDANTAYHKAVTIPVNELEFVIFPNKKDALNLVNVGKISVLFHGDMDRDTLISNMNVSTTNFISNQAEFIAFNTASGIMRNQSIRQAVAYAVDSKEILEKVYLKSGVLSNTIYYPSYFGNKNETESYPYDIDKAAALISEAGFRDYDGDGYLDNQNGDAVSVRILVNSDDQARVDASQIIKNALDKLALDSYIIYCGWNEYLARISSGDYDIYLGGYTFNERYDLRNILHSEYNRIGYSNQELDILLDEMVSGVSNAQRAKLFEEANTILQEELPYYCILYKTYGAISSKSLIGDIKPLFNNYYNNCGAWVCTYETSAAVAE